MPPTQVVFYQDDDGSVPAIDWLLALPAKVRDKLFVRIERLQSLGYELRRPEADFLRDGIYELRVRHKRMNYRLLYFFHDDVAAVVSHGLLKQRIVPPKEIDRAIERKIKLQRDPQRHTHFREEFE